jgi:hypothetical protein
MATTGKLTWDLDAERQLWASVCAPGAWFDPETGKAGGTHPESLWHFIHIAWGAEFFMEDNRRRWLVKQSSSGYHIHDAYLKWLQTHLLEWKDDRRNGRVKRRYLAIILPRNFGKSITATRCASLWTHLDDPNMSTLIASATEKLSKDFVSSIGLTISGQNKEQAWFSWLYGNWKNPNREWTNTAFHHAFRRNISLQEPSYDMTAVGAGMTGYHHDQHWWDDPIIKNKIRDGGTYMDTVHTAFNASFKAVQRNGLLALVCTRYLDDDVAGRHFTEDGIASWSGMPNPNSMVFRKHALGEGIWHVYFWQAEDEVKSIATCPEIMDEASIAVEKGSDPEDFACQYQNDPGTSIHAPLSEEQIRDLFVDYKDLKHEYPIEAVSYHLDTAFKSPDAVRAGDYNAIVPVFHDVRPNGYMYVDTDRIRHSNEWRSDQFSDELVAIMQQHRRMLIPCRCVTDEAEMGGKGGLYRQNFISTMKSAGLRFGRFHQFPRQGTNKRQRIRKAAGLIAEGYMRFFLHKRPGCQCTSRTTCSHWIIPPAARALFNELIRVDVTAHDDLADAVSDAFMPEVWRKPIFATQGLEETMAPHQPGDEGLKFLSRRMTDEELRVVMVDHQRDDFNNGLGPEAQWLPARHPYD